MKTNFLKYALMAFLFTGLVSCGGDDDLNTGGELPTEGTLQGTVLTGTLTKDLLVKKGNYTIKGAVFVENGATLTIEKGSTFTVTKADQAAGINLIMVKQGGKLIANGTKEEPILFTTENKNGTGGDGDWGGITLHGYAKMNAPGGTSLSEAGQLTYGGTDDADSSGSLKYVIVEYAGQASSDGKFEYNAFSFFACGSGTVVDHCEAIEGADDGFEFYGGTVNASNLSMVGMEDDSIDWDHGYRGTLSNIVIYQYDNIGDFAFESASRSGENNATPRSKPTVNNVTIRGSGRTGKSGFDLKQGTGGVFNNIVGTNFDTVIFLNNQLQEVISGDLEFANAKFSVFNTLINNKTQDTSMTTAEIEADLISVNANATGADKSEFAGWSTYGKKGY